MTTQPTTPKAFVYRFKTPGNSFIYEGHRGDLIVFNDPQQALSLFYDFVDQKRSTSPEEAPEGALECDYLPDFPDPEALLHWWADGFNGAASFGWMTEEELEEAAKDFYATNFYQRCPKAFDRRAGCVAIPNPFEDDEDEA